MDISPNRRPRQAAVAFIFITIVIDMMTFGIAMPVLPRLIEDFRHGDTQQAAHIYGVLTAIWALMQFIASPIQGALSDRFGRRPVILASNFGLAFQFVILAVAPNLAWVFVGRALSGVTSSSIATANAYIADVTPPELRAQRYGLMGMAFGIGFIMGPAIGGLLGEHDPRLPFWVAAACSFLNACYGIFVLPESLAPENRAAFSWRRANPVGSLDLLRMYPALLSLSGVQFLYVFSQSVFPSVLVLYLGYRYHWGAGQIGLTFALVGLLSVLGQGLLIRPALRRWGERNVLLAGLAAGVVSFSLSGWAPQGFIFLAAIPITSVWQWAQPANQALMTSYVLPHQQGRLQGAIASLGGISAFIGPLAFTALFAHFIAPERAAVLPGAPFYLAAALMVAAFAAAWRYAHKPPADAVPAAPPVPAAPTPPSGEHLTEEITHRAP